MKILDILEAKYYQRPPLEAIMKRSRGLINNTRGDEVWLHDSWISSLNKVKQFYAKFVIRGPRTKERVQYMVQHFLEAHDIPYTEIYGIVQDTIGNTATRWNATIRYEPKHQARRTYIKREEEVTEAKYYGRHTAKSVYRRLVDRANIQTDPRNILMSYIYDVEMEEGIVKAKVYVFDVDSEQHAISQAERLLHLHGIPFTDIGGSMHVGQNRWILIMTYKPTVTEARYYGRHNVDDIIKRLEQLSKASGASIRSSASDIIVGDAMKHKDGMYVHFIVRGAKVKEDIKDKIRHYLRHHNIPYTDIYEIVRHSLPNDVNPMTRWTAIMSYFPDRVTEAKYYGKHHVDDVRNRLERIARKHNKYENVRVLEAWLAGWHDETPHEYQPIVVDLHQSDTVFAHVYVVDADDEKDADNEIRSWLKKFGIPFTRIQDLEEYPTPINDQRSAWEATVVYKP